MMYSRHAEPIRPRGIVRLAPRPAPRGNAVVLAAGLLALLVILATVFIVRTQGNRQTASAVSAALQREDVVDITAELLAQSAADALFVRPVNVNQPNPAGLDVRDSNLRRYPASDPAGILLPSDRGRYGIDTNFPFNYAPHHVVPWTNWPDELPGGTLGLFPIGAGAPSGVTDLGESNPLGNPGQGDARWLRCFEPVRWDMLRGEGASFGTDPDTFRYWRHLTNLSRDDNGLRVVADITNVMNRLVLDLNIPVEQWLVSIPPAEFNYNTATGTPRLATFDFQGANINADGFVSNDFQNSFMDRWLNWMGSFNGYANTYRLPDFIPQNLYDLGALGGLSVRNLPGSRPEDEFVPGTARWLVSRILADTDGDGKTDALWHMLPGTSPDGTIHLVAASIVDNSAMINANVATRFRPGIDAAFNVNGPTPAQLDAVVDSLFDRSTAGETPADIALIGGNANIAVGQLPATPLARNNWNVGFLDVLRGREIFMDYVPQQYAGTEKTNPYGRSSLEVAFNFQRWQSFLGEIGHGDVPYPPANIPLMTARERRFYWLASGRHVETPDPAGYVLDDNPNIFFVPTPFGMPEEIELRSFHGHNHHWKYSRLERALNVITPNSFADPVFAFLRSDIEFAEAGPFNSHTLNELLHDKRRTMTVSSAARNDLLPGWLRWRPRTIPLVPGGAVDFILPSRIFALQASPPAGLTSEEIVDRFFAQSARKLDLRESTRLLADPSGLPPQDGTLAMHERLPQVLLNVFSDTAPVSDFGAAPVTRTGRSYFGTYNLTGIVNPNDEMLRRVRRLAAAYSANILAYRSEGDVQSMDGNPATAVIEPGWQGGAIPLPEWGELPADPTERYLGMKKQPFLMEAFVGHMYDMFRIPESVIIEGLEVEYEDAGERVVLATNEAGDSLATSFAVVQIANPFAQPLTLYQPSGPYQEYGIRLFGNEIISLADIAAQLGVFELPPATERRPSTMILYAIEGDFLGISADPDDVPTVIPFRQKVRRFLDILEAQHPPDTIFVDLRDPALQAALPSVWSTSRGPYDNHSGHSIELLYRDQAIDPATTERYWVVIDRAETNPTGVETFSRRVSQLIEPPTYGDAVGPASLPPGPPPFTARFEDQITSPEFLRRWYVGPQDSVQTRTHFMQWVRFTRAWGIDTTGHRSCITNITYPPTNPDNPTAGNEFYRSNERAPRFVMSYADVSGPERAQRPDSSVPFAVNSYEPFPIDERILNKVQPSLPSTGSPPDVDYFARGHLFVGDDRPNEATDYPATAIPPSRGLPWFTVRYVEDVHIGPCVPGAQPQIAPVYWHRKPTFFDMNRANDPVSPLGQWSYPDKGFYGSRDATNDINNRLMHFPFQMLQKNGDFQQVGELLNVWLFGHRLEFSADPPPNDGYLRTLKTFAEHMTDTDLLTISGTQPLNERVRRNRVERRVNRNIGGGDNLDLRALTLAAPPMPAISRLMEAFVCDGPGINYFPEPPFNHLYENFVFGNANEFTDRPTPGLININTAPVEVLRSLPHWYKVVHATSGSSVTPLIFNPRTAIPEAIISYRERYENYNGVDLLEPESIARRGIGFAGTSLDGTEILPGPNWFDRQSGVRGDRGFASIGELMMLDRSAPTSDQVMQLGFSLPVNSTVNSDHIVRPDAWRIDFGALDPFGLSAPLFEPQPPFGTFISTDVVDLNVNVFDVSSESPVSPQTPGYDPLVVGDGTAGDVEERNLLLSGASNLITTRSDVFTVSFRIRSVRRNPRTGLYNALDPEFIVNDARYVMQVDRSSVNRPGDRPRILFLERMPF